MISCRFSCSQCGLTDVLVSVRARESPDEDVVKWMSDHVIIEMVRRHNMLSPQCRTRSLTNLKIPVEAGDDCWVGKQTELIPPCGDPKDAVQKGGKEQV